MARRLLLGVIICLLWATQGVAGGLVNPYRFGSSGGSPTVIYDTFTRADGNIGVNWTTITGLGTPTVSSNTATGTGAASGGAYWSANTFSPDQYAKGTILAATGFSLDLRVRQSTTADTAYFVSIDQGRQRVYKVVGGVTYTELGTAVFSTTTVNDVFEVRVSGSSPTSITVYKNGTPIKTTSDSSSPLTSGYPGFKVANGTYFDNFEAGDL